MSNAFKDYVTSTAFHLHLSRNMCEAMEFCVLDQTGRGSLHVIPTIPHIMTMRCLVERGLVERAPYRPCAKLTEAGELVYSLLVLAGLVRSREELLERHTVSAGVAPSE